MTRRGQARATRHQRADRPRMPGSSARLVACHRGEPRRRVRPHANGAGADDPCRQGPHRRHHQLRRRLSMAAPVRLCSVKGRARQAHRDSGRGDAPAQRVCVQRRSRPAADRSRRGRADKHCRGTDTPRGRVDSWVREQFAAGRGADPEAAARLVLALASGKADRFSGRHLSVTDDINALLARIDRIERGDLHTLRLRT
jgi:hypothetical protein